MGKTIQRFYLIAAILSILAFLTWNAYNLYQIRNITIQNIYDTGAMNGEEIIEGISSLRGLLMEEKKNYIKDWVTNEESIRYVKLYSHDKGNLWVVVQPKYDIKVIQRKVVEKQSFPLLESLLIHSLVIPLEVPNAQGVDLLISVQALSSTLLFNRLFYLLFLLAGLILVAFLLISLQKYDTDIQTAIPRTKGSATQVSTSSLEDWINHQLKIIYKENRDLTLAFLTTDNGSIVSKKKVLENHQTILKLSGRFYKVGQKVLALLLPGTSLPRAIKHLTPMLREETMKGGFTSLNGRRISARDLVEEAKAALRKARNENTTLYGFQSK